MQSAAGVDVVEHLLLLFGEVQITLDRRALDTRRCGLRLLDRAHLGKEGGDLITGVLNEGLGAEVNCLCELFLGELCADVGGTLDNWGI